MGSKKSNFSYSMMGSFSASNGCCFWLIWTMVVGCQNRLLLIIVGQVSDCILLTQVFNVLHVSNLWMSCLKKTFKIFQNCLKRRCNTKKVKYVDYGLRHFAFWTNSNLKKLPLLKGQFPLSGLISTSPEYSLQPAADGTNSPPTTLPSVPPVCMN